MSLAVPSNVQHLSIGSTSWPTRLLQGLVQDSQC